MFHETTKRTPLLCLSGNSPTLILSPKKQQGQEQPTSNFQLGPISSIYKLGSFSGPGFGERESAELGRPVGGTATADGDAEAKAASKGKGGSGGTKNVKAAAAAGAQKVKAGTSTSAKWFKAQYQKRSSSK